MRFKKPDNLTQNQFFALSAVVGLVVLLVGYMLLMGLLKLIAALLPVIIFFAFLAVGGYFLVKTFKKS
jgi:uncharacterized membrane protein YkgB